MLPSLRWVIAPFLGALAVLLLFAFLSWAATPREVPLVEEGTVIEGVAMVKPQEEAPEPLPEPEPELPENLPTPPPDAPPSLERPAMPNLDSAAALTNIEIDAGPVVVNVNVNTQGMALGAGTAGDSIQGLGELSGLLGGGGGAGGGGGGTGFGGFAGAGSGGSAASYAKGTSFVGKTLIPLSTARPQMPEWACKQKIKGWVEVVFVVLPSGRVQNVKIVDAEPRGVYEAAAIESVSNWIYATSKRAREVKQRVQMNPEDCEYNYNYNR